MRILVLDKAFNYKEPQLACSFHIYETLLNEGFTCIYHVIRSIADIEKVIDKLPFDKIFLCTVNDWGNNGTLQHTLEFYNVDYTFSNAAVSLLCYDKTKTKKWLDENKYPVPATFDKENAVFPCILKTLEGEASQGVFFIENESELEKHTEAYFLEEYLGKEWQEYTVSLLNGVVGNPVLIDKDEPVWKNRTPESIVLEYENKSDIRNLIQKPFTSIYRNMGIRDACRIDFMVNGGKYKILEINSMPVITPNSVFTLSMVDYNSDINYTAIIKQIAGNK